MRTYKQRDYLNNGKLTLLLIFFLRALQTTEYEPGSDLSFLLTDAQ